jgi:CRISPR/Cas system-associated exonuclease Cas4 (RecB family)
MTDPALKNLKDTYRRRDILLPSIERHVLKKAKEPSERRMDILHPSEMAKSGWCSRHDYYRVIGENANYKKRSPSFKLENVFDYGHSVHHKYQNWLNEMGILWGKWRCSECSNEWTALSPGECPSCRSLRVKYREVSLVSDELMIAGHSDGVVLLDGSYKMIEIKTVGLGTLRFEAYSLFDKYQTENLTLDELWWNIKRPFATHLRQGQIYLHLIRDVHPELDINEIIFIYEWKPTQDVREFVVQYNPELIDRILVQAAAVADAVNNGHLIERPEWAKSIEEKTCASCEYRNTCWGENNDSEEDSSSKPTIRIKRSTAAKRSRVVRP